MPSDSIPKKPLLRPARFSDILRAGAFCIFLRDRVREERGTMRSSVPSWLSQARSLFLRWRGMKRQNLASLTAWQGGQVVGDCLVVRLEGRQGHVGRLHIAVDARYRRKGLGRALVEGVLEQVYGFHEPLALVLLSVEGRNKPARSFYQALGFAEQAVLPGMVRSAKTGQTDDEIVMVRHLIA